MIINGTGHDSKVLEPGDKVKCKGITCTIAEITFQEYWEDDGFYTEFRDTNGVYRSWKQRVDGGEVIPKITFEEIIKSDCGQCFGGYGGDSACDTCEFSERCRVLTSDLDSQ